MQRQPNGNGVAPGSGSGTPRNVPLPPGNMMTAPSAMNSVPGAGPYAPAGVPPGWPNAAPWMGSADVDYGYDDDMDEAQGGDMETDGRDLKRRRIARACDMCRKKKIKCDGKMPKCSHCENYKTECIFTQVEKKRAPPKGAKYIEGLENRLGRMENLLRLSGLLAEDDGGRTDLGTLEKRLAEQQGSQSASQEASPLQVQASPGARDSLAHRTASRTSTPQGRVVSPVTNGRIRSPTKSPPGAVTSQQPERQQAQTRNPSQRDVKEVDALADQMCSLITNNCGETRYIGSSSGFSIFSPKGIQWVNEKTGDQSFQSMIANATSEQKAGAGWDHWKPEVFNDLFQRRVFKPLPPRGECEALLRDFFEHFNQMFPLFHEPTFMHLVDKHYSDEPYEGSGWWASLNVALAISHRLRVMSNVVSQEEDDHAWGYLKNAMAVMTELTMRNTDLLSVQALLGMALFLQGTPNPQPSFFLVAAAIRLAHSIGLHKRGSGFNLNEVENEQRKRVFWIAYLLDKDLCLRSGRPPSQDDDDMNVELPSEDPPDNVGNVPLQKEERDGRKTMNLFRLMCTFAQIQSRVYKQLYSVRASRQSDGELLNTIGQLDSELEAWKDSIPIDFRPEHPINAAHTPLILHVVCLHFAYYNCLTTIHRMSVHHGYWTSRLSEYAIQGLNARPLNPRVFMSAALCVNAARTSIGLIRYIPQGDYACVWLILYYPVSALVTLFANILQNPQDARARSDLKLMSSVVSFLNMLERDALADVKNGNVGRMLSVCAEFERIARVVLDKAERELRSGRGKRKVAGTGLTERERAKEMRDRGETEKLIDEAIEEGKTLEQMQVETQAGYRRPVPTSSLRQSTGTSPSSQQGSNAEHRSPAPMAGHTADSTNQQQQAQAQNQQWISGMQGAFTGSNGQMDFNNLSPPQQTSSSGRSPINQPPPGPAFFPQVSMANQPAFQANGFSPAANDLMPTSGNFDPLTTSFDPGNGIAGAGLTQSFQQPFVPQDLWQMPMTLEWDWAEGFGLGAFTPGAGTGMFGDGMGNGGLYDGFGANGDGNGQGS